MSNGKQSPQKGPTPAAPPPAILASGGGVAPPKGAASDGFAPLAGSRVDVTRWLDQHDFLIGHTLHLRLLDAQLIADEERGYRVAYVAELLGAGLPARPAKDVKGKDVKKPEALAAGHFVMFGEKHDLRSLRRCYVGDEVKLTVSGIKDLAGGRTLMTFAQAVNVAARRAFDAKAMPKLLGTLLTEAWRSGATTGGDEWEQAAKEEPAPF